MIFQSELDDNEKRVRDAFVDEYLYDFDPTAACIRLGFNVGVAATMGARFMAETYVMNKLKESASKTKNPDEIKNLAIQALLQALREGSTATKVNAAGVLLKVYAQDENNQNQDLTDVLRQISEKLPQ